MRVIATAGHVDHGKSTLVLALTGTDPDRFAEEKERGLTIDLGFAFTTLPSGTEVGFVDVPGHSRFIKNMLAGVGAVDVVLLVVAANEGWMPQSEEHLRIVEVLGIGHGLTVLTKAELVDGETLEIARLELDDHLAASPLAGGPVVVCDAVSGRGLDELRAALDTVLASAPLPVDRGRARLWVDRVFAVRGAGTVVTGTLTGGTLAVDDTVEVGTSRRSARVRAIEAAHRGVERIGPGNRVALNLAGIEHRDVRRGDAVVHPGDWQAHTVFEVALTPFDGVRVRSGAAFHAHVGSGEHEAAVRVLDADGRLARLFLADQVPLAPGDRLILRDSGRRQTLGGAEVLHIGAMGRSRAATTDALARPIGPRLLAGRGWLDRDDIGSLAGLDPDSANALADELVDDGEAVAVGRWLVAPTVLEHVRAAATERVLAHHKTRPHDPGVELPALASSLRIHVDRLRAALDGADDVVVERGTVRHASRGAQTSETSEGARLVGALRAELLAPPDPSDLGAAPGLVRALVREGALVDIDGVVFAAEALDEARARVGQALRDRGSLTIADVRDLLGSTRKFVVPLVNRLDAEGVTRRRGDERVAGPTLARG